MRPAFPLLPVLLATPLGACGDHAEPVPTVLDDETLARLADFSPMPPLPADPTNRVADDPDAARLGQFLFFDERLSSSGGVSCATCHDPARGFTDGRQLAVGIGTGSRATPTLWNVAWNRWFNWDGRADSLWMQALGPLEDPLEMGSSRTELAALVARDDALRAAYEGVFGPLPDVLGDADAWARPARPDPDAPRARHARAWRRLSDARRDAIDTVFANLGKCLAAYERRLARVDAPFDRFAAAVAAGDAEAAAAYPEAAQRGFALFVGRANCVLCHVGPAFSDGEFHNNSLPTLYGEEPDDPGRYEGIRALEASAFHAAGPHSDAPDGAAARRVGRLVRSSESWGAFKTPTLRNLAGRAPFMHLGQFADLRAVLDFYSTLEGASGRGHHQEQILVPLRLRPEEKADLLTFLETLEGTPADPELLVPLESPLPPR